ncbi:RNA methyltransferase, TrmH family [Actinopolymorpha cephalotaxi]|uniref:RNA methyltransferase, TrmH family n=1 Tax=Actinopolymorpha cephalotaxi TaxID=504797 RepID=A0A1I2VZT0_9ACTN|nr:TrmH family RNA methyltransferase [Actinopolymorpha cephalotaxi]NYH82825.1 TrmH family RNA methyltransferase [Actinopolymorpha cephalotaxi]SFG94522.1 RNA methyltransferase, TrmH family [Actinopolymorpha cephalotaxi]
MTPQRVGLHHPRLRPFLAAARNTAPPDEDHVVVEGIWALEKLLAARTPVETFLCCPELVRTPQARRCADALRERAEAAYEIGPKVLSRLSGRARPDGLLALAGLPRRAAGELEFGDRALVLVADGIEYAGNLGTLIRTADACSADCVVLVRRQVRPNHPRVFVASRGTVLGVPLVELPDPASAIAWLGRCGFTVVVAEPGASRDYRAGDLSGPRTAVVVGSEGRGVSSGWYAAPVRRVSIPMLGSADSLNVSVSAALLLYEVLTCRSRRTDGAGARR